MNKLQKTSKPYRQKQTVLTRTQKKRVINCPIINTMKTSKIKPFRGFFNSNYLSFIEKNYSPTPLYFDMLERLFIPNL